MYQFHATLHAAPGDCPAKGRQEIDGQAMEVLDIAPGQLASCQFACSFEDAAVRLAALDRMHVEPDGSFVWVCGPDDPHWQVDGNLYDRAGKLQFVELKGCCTLERFNELLRSFGWPTQQVIFQLVRHGVIIDEREFRRWANDVEPNV